MKLFPRHKKIIQTLLLRGCSDPNYLSQAAGVYDHWFYDAISSLKRAGIIRWSFTWSQYWSGVCQKLMRGGRRNGYRLTDKGYKVAAGLFPDWANFATKRRKKKAKT